MAESNVVALAATRTVKASPYLLLPLRTLEQAKKSASASYQCKSTVDSSDSETPTGRNAAADGLRPDDAGPCWSVSGDTSSSALIGAS